MVLECQSLRFSLRGIIVVVIKNNKKLTQKVPVYKINKHKENYIIFEVISKLKDKE